MVFLLLAFLCRENIEAGELQGGWNDNEQLAPLRPHRAPRMLNVGKAIQRHLAKYYSSPQGRVRWQDRMVAKNRGKESLLFFFFFLQTDIKF